MAKMIEQSVATEKICQPVETQQVCKEQKRLPCRLIGQLAAAVKYIQSKVETISSVQLPVVRLFITVTPSYQYNSSPPHFD